AGPCGKLDRLRGLDPLSPGLPQGLLEELAVLADDAAGPGVGGGVVDRLGLTVEVRRGDEVDPAVAVAVAEPADHAVDVADALGAAVLPDQRTTVGTRGHGRLQTDGLLGLQLAVDRGVGLAVGPLLRHTGVRLVARSEERRVGNEGG